MGSDPKQDRDAYAHEKPQQRLYLPEFFIGKYPVTVAQFGAFVQATGQFAKVYACGLRPPS